MSLWDRNKPLTQPPHYQRTGAVIHDQNKPFDPAEHSANIAIEEGKEIRRRFKSSVFDKSTKGSR